MPRTRTLPRSQPVFPASVHDPVLGPELLKLHAAMELDPLWSAMLRLIDLCVPCRDVIAALPCEGIQPMIIRSTIPGDPDEYWGRINRAEPPLGAMVAQHPGLRLADIDEQFSDEELKATRFWKEIMEPDGWRHSVALLAWDGPRLVGHVGLNREAAQGRFTVEEKALLVELQPHFEVAMNRVAAWSRERRVRQMLAECMEHPLEGVVLLDLQGRQMHHNRAARAACDRWNDHPSDSRGAVHLPPEISAAAAEIVSGFLEAMRDHPRPGAVEVELDHPSLPGLSARLRVVEPARQANWPYVMVTFSRRVGAAQHMPVFRLTSSEHRVALLVAGGLRNEEVARELSVSVHTIRSHLREIFAKLGVRHRGELSRHLAVTDASLPTAELEEGF
ncbi:DNA-binding CsgD family transcriptional regulator [Haloferula luteola]|uniref:DNA-binding CsgD family transcriptional regulator n=1 Tax=Haloferula luteola TaxID=595692 RepID=A0A840V7K6_9BACT|nr:helix-turn-helix transcriptional regulator [Haloferula luteola]MBB5353026.1 DNA-binding CsgD family transcriptional regulator [Haloferula luteola]